MNPLCHLLYHLLFHSPLPFPIFISISTLCLTFISFHQYHFLSTAYYYSFFISNSSLILLCLTMRSVHKTLLMNLSNKRPEDPEIPVDPSVRQHWSQDSVRVVLFFLFPIWLLKEYLF